MNLPAPRIADKVKYLTPEEARRLQELIRSRLIEIQDRLNRGERYRKRLVSKFRDYLLVLFYLETGARLREALNVRRKHLRIFEEKPHIVIPTLKRREYMERKVPVFNDFFISMLNNYILYRETLGEKVRQDDPIFPISERQVQRVVKDILLHVITDPDRAHPHTLRHTFGILWTIRGLNPFILASWMGHATLNTTMIYTQIAIRDNYEYARRLYENGGF